MGVRASLVAQMVKNPTAMPETDPDLIPGSERSPVEENRNPLQCPCLENYMDRGTGRAIVPGITESDTNEQLMLSFHFRMGRRDSYGVWNGQDTLLYLKWITN